MGCNISVPEILSIAEQILQEFDSMSFVGKMFESLTARNECPKETECGKLKQSMQCRVMRATRDSYETIALSWLLIFVLVVFLIYLKFPAQNRIENQQAISANRQEVQMQLNTNSCPSRELTINSRGRFRPVPPLRRARGSTSDASERDLESGDFEYLGNNRDTRY